MVPMLNEFKFGFGLDPCPQVFEFFWFGTSKSQYFDLPIKWWPEIKD